MCRRQYRMYKIHASLIVLPHHNLVDSSRYRNCAHCLGHQRHIPYQYDTLDEGHQAILHEQAVLDLLLADEAEQLPDVYLAVWHGTSL